MFKVKERLKRVKEDHGASHIISFMFIMFFTMIIILSFLDIGIYFNSKGELQNAAENGARNVALYGGTEGSFRAAKGGTPAVDVVRASIKSNFEATSRGTQVVQVNSIECGPGSTGAGAPVWCKVSYKYNGIAGPFSLFSIVKNSDTVVYGTGVSEVNVK